MSVEEKQELQGLGFRCPQGNSEEASPLDTSRPALSDCKKEHEHIRKQLYLLHCTTGHSHPRHMLKPAKQRGADPRTLELAESFGCPVCSEKS